MKIFSQFNFRSVFIGLMMAASLAACSDDDSNIVGNGNGNGDGEPEFIELSGVLSSQTLTPDNKYLLLGQVFVDRKSTRLNSSHVAISYAVFCLKKKMTAV